MKEQISALIDGEVSELERERALRALRDDSVLRHTWDRYHLVSSALRRELEMVVRPGLAERIHARLQHESPDTAVPRLPGPRFLKLTAGLAIAASVAAVAILNLSPLTLNSQPVNTAKPVTVNPTAVAIARQTPPEQQRALNPYLMHHGEYTSTTGMNGMISYVRVVGRNSASVVNANAE